jgi:hypothetical protein
MQYKKTVGRTMVQEVLTNNILKKGGLPKFIFVLTFFKIATAVHRLFLAQFSIW